MPSCRLTPASPKHPTVSRRAHHRSLGSARFLQAQRATSYLFIVHNLAVVRPNGCPFHPRCPYREQRCEVEEPALVESGAASGASHLVACHFHHQLTLRTFAD